MLKSLYTFRYFILVSIKNNLINKYTKNNLGFLWIILGPLSQALIYTVILSNVLAAKLPGVENFYGYAIYLLGGLLAWSLLSEIISSNTNLFIDNANTIKKVSFPKITLVAINTGVSSINNLFLFLSIFIIVLLTGHQISFHYLLLIPMAIITAIFAQSIGLILGIFNVFIRDVGQAVPILLQLLFWFTPIVYPISIVPEFLKTLIQYNPIFHIVDCYQQIILYNSVPNIMSIFIIIFLSVFFSILSIFLFRKAGREMADVL